MTQSPIGKYSFSGYTSQSVIRSRTGRVQHGLGNVRFDQGRIQESEDLHRKALAHYQRTIGNNHHKTADLCHRVAQHCMRREERDNAL